MSLSPGTRVVHKVSRQTGLVLDSTEVLGNIAFPDGDQLVPWTDLEVIARDLGETLLSGKKFNPELAWLRNMAQLIQHSYQFDPGAGLSNARLEPQLHQAFVAHRVVARKVTPRMILADEVGLGKTIEAGLIIKELRARGLAQRVLVIAPASLTRQWQLELKSKFNEEFELIDGAAAKHFGKGGTNPFEIRNSIICSLNFATLSKRSEQILEIPWDAVIFDEAHRVRKSQAKTTLAYKLAEQLADIANAFLLLTATPVQLHSNELLSLIDLVEPGLFGSAQDYEASRLSIPKLSDLMKDIQRWPLLAPDKRDQVLQKNKQLLAELDLADSTELQNDDFRDEFLDRIIEIHPTADVMIRNRKRDLNLNGTRRARTLLIEMTPEEFSIYEDLFDYIRMLSDNQSKNKKGPKGFVLTAYQRMVTSSSRSLRTSLQKRISMLTASSISRASSPGEDFDPTDVEEQSDVLEAAENYRADADLLTVERELFILNDLCDRLNQIRDGKALKLYETLKSLDEEERPKVVIFTQYIQTQLYLQELLEGWGFSSVIFNGTMSLDDKEQAIAEFRTSAQILISTESGGEGRNLQFSHILINYDLPWNPMKVEQRIGRIDRIGQKHVVVIINLVYENTLEERIVSVLENRIRIFEESVGDLDPILSSFEADVGEIALSTPLSEIGDKVEGLGEDLESKVREAELKERTMEDFVLNRASFRKDGKYRWLEEKPLASYEDLLALTQRGLADFGGTLIPHDRGGLQLATSEVFAMKLGFPRMNLRGVFDPQEAVVRDDIDFFAVGHPVIDRMTDFFSKLEDGAIGYREVDEEMDGLALEVVWRMKGTVVIPEAELVRHVIDQTGELRHLPLCKLPTHDSIPEQAFDIDLDFARSALADSRLAFHATLANFTRTMLEKQEVIREKKLRRLRRVHANQRTRIQHEIDREQAWVDDAEMNPTANLIKILPARRSKLQRRKEDLQSLVSRYEYEVSELEGALLDVRGEMFSVSVIRGKSETNRIRS